MNFKTKLALATAVSITMAIPAAADAAVISLTNLTATWYNAFGGTNVDADNNGTGSARIDWGNDIGNGQSGYRFTRTGNPITTDVPPSTAFALGTFTHFNNAIGSGSSITAVSLRLITTILVDGVSVGSKSFDYLFNHNETPNQIPCAFPSNTPCADQVTVSSLPTSQAFSVGGVNYTIAFSGFEVGGVTTDAFTSQEGGNRNALLKAIVTAAAVPEPATWAMMISGFGLIGAGMRRSVRRTAAAIA